MRSHGAYGVARALLMCFLVLAASGDDLNLLRMAVPAAFLGGSGDPLPLDDQNTDFNVETVSAYGSLRVKAVPGVARAVGRGCLHVALGLAPRNLSRANPPAVPRSRPRPGPLPGPQRAAVRTPALPLRC